MKKLDIPGGTATTAELMLEFGKSIEDALKIERDLENIVKKNLKG